MFKLWVIGLLAACAMAAGAAPEKVREAGGITEYRLANGLQVLLMPVAGAGRTHVTVTYRVGSRMEGQGEAGMAHLLEHVTYRGVRSEGDQVLDLGAVLASMPLAYNGTTTNDRTNYLESFVPDRTVLARVLELEARRMNAARLEPGDFDKEKPIVLNEMGLRGESLAVQMDQALAAAAFRVHPYGRATIGSPADIEAMSIQRLRAFYAQYYRPDNAALMLAGEFDVEQALSLVERYFGALPRPATPLPELQLQEPAQKGPRLIVTRAEQSAVGVAYRVPGWAHPQAAAVEMMWELLPLLRGPGRGDHGEEVAPMQTAVGGVTSRDPYLIEIVWPLNKTQSNDAASREALLKRATAWADQIELTRIAGYTGDSIRRVIEDRRSRLRLQLRDPQDASVLVSDAIGAGDWRLPLRMLDDLEKLEPRQVIRTFNQYFTAENRSLAVGVTDPAVSTAQFSEGAVGGVLGWFSKPSQVETVNDVGATVGSLDHAGESLGRTGGESFEFDAGKLDAAVQSYRLPSGIVIDVLDRKTADDRIHVLMRFNWGSPQAMAAEKGWRGLVSQFLEMGTAGERSFSARDIAVVQSRLQLFWSLSSQPQQLLVSMSMPREQFGPALALTRALLREPALNASTFHAMKEATIKALGDTKEEPDWAPELARRHHMQALGLRLGDVGYVPGNSELIALWKDLDISDVKDFYEHRWSANRMRVSIVGPVPSALETAGTVEQLFGTWKRPQAPDYVRAVPEFKPEQGARFVSARSEASKGQPFGSAHIAFLQGIPLNEGDRDAVPLLLGLQVLGAPGVAGSRLSDRLRGREALSYSIDLVTEIPAVGNVASVGFAAVASPANAARAEEVMREELARLLDQGISEAELAAAKRKARAASRARLGNDAALARMLLAQQEAGSNFATAAAREEAALESATVQSVNEALRRLLKPDAWVVIVTGASKEAAAAPAVKAP